MRVVIYYLTLREKKFSLFFIQKVIHRLGVDKPVRYVIVIMQGEITPTNKQTYEKRNKNLQRAKTKAL